MKNTNILSELYKGLIGVKSWLSRGFVLILALFTLTVGNVWAEPWIWSNTSGGNKGTKTVGDKLNGGSEWNYDFAVNGGWDNGWVKTYVGTSTSHYQEVGANWTADWDKSSNKSVRANIGNVLFDESGKWYAVGAYNPDGGSTIVYTTTYQNWTNNTTLSFGSNNEAYWTVNPPAVSSFSVARSGYLAGDGTSENPYLVASGSTLTLTASGNQAITDANSSVNYKFGSDAYSTTATKNITVSSSGSIAVKARCINSSASLNGTETSAVTIYYAPVSVKDITVYIYVGERTEGEAQSVEMNGCTPYVGTKALSAVSIHTYNSGSSPKFTKNGNWLEYTFTNVTKVSSITCARSGGNIFTGEITNDVYYKYDGTALDGKCVARTTPTWNVAPANGAAGGSMTATINNVPDGATVTWSSSATSYATVNSSGVISYVAAGSATISARIQKAASGDYCALDETISQAITVTSGATVSATRACPEYVSSNSGQVKLDISSTGASTGWYYRVCNSAKTAYYAPDEQSAASNTLSWTMNGSLLTGSNTLVVELYNSARQLVCTSSSVTVNVEIAESVTISAGANGSVSPSGTVYANNNHVHPTITATANTNYHFVNWTSNNAAASVANANNATTTVTATASGYTITANFAGNQYTITYKDQGDVTYSGNNEGSLPATHTYGTATALVNGTKAGYTFGGWYTDASCTSSAGSSIGATAKTSNFTLYAKWTERMSTLSTSNSYSVGDPSFAAPTQSVSSIGISTTATVTAHANELGYTLTSWTITGGTRTDGGAANANPITVCSNGDGAAVSVTANYVGSNTPVDIFLPNTGNSWSTSDVNWKFYKLPGESGNTVTLAVDINKYVYSDSGYKLGFNIYQAGWTNKWWHNKSDGDSNMDAHNCTNWGFNTSEGEHKTNLDLNVSGTYTFTLTNSNNSGTQQLSVTYPDKSFIEGAFPTAWSEDAYTLTEDGNIQSVTINITSTGDKEFRLVSHGKLFGTSTKITAAANSQTLSAKNMADDGAVMTLAAYVTGEYTFSYNKSTKVLTVTFPIYNQVRISAASPADAGNVGNYDLSEPVSNVRTVTRSLNANTTYTFKVLYESEWYGFNSGTFTRESSTSSNSRTLSTSGGDMTLTTDYAGSYTFRFNQSTKALSIDFPTAYTVTYGVGTSYTSMGSVSTSPSITSGYYVIAGTNITFTATPNLGYKFVGWYSDAGCNTQISTDNPYTVSVNVEKTVYAKFELLTLYMNSDINNWESAVALTHTTENPAVYTYTGTLNANPTTDATTYATGWHFEYCYNPERTEKAYQYTTVQTPLTYSGSSIDGVHTYSGANTIQFGLTRKSDITITLTLQATPAKPTVNIAADPYYTITYGAPTHGSYTIKVGSAGAVGANTESTAEKTITLTPSPATGYHFDHWTVTKAGGGTVTVTSNQFAMPSDDVTIAATFMPTSYDVTLQANGGEGENKVVTATYDAAMPPTLKGGGLLTAHSRTGYNFTGYYDDESAGTQYYDNSVSSVRPWDKASTANLFAHWTPKTTTITFIQSGTGYGSGAPASQTATYDAAMPAITPPTAAAGYCFMGYYDALEPLGTQYYTSTGASAQNWNKEDAAATLYAYFKQAEITNIELNSTVLDPVTEGEGWVIANPTIEPTPAPTTIICWELLYDNNNPVEGHNAISTENGEKTNEVKFSIAGLAAGSYKVKATLRAGDNCSAPVLDTREASFSIASGFTVTIQYKDASGNTIASSTTSPGKATEWTSISAPDIFGYTFSTWVLGDGITANSALTTCEDFQFKATFNGTLTAQYTKNKYIYLDLSQTFSSGKWDNPWVYFYTSAGYWGNDNKGAGATDAACVAKGAMTQIEGTDIWYYDYSSVPASFGNKLAFTWGDKHDQLNFYDVDAIYRTDFSEGTPLFVPAVGQSVEQKNNNHGHYYNKGYWTNYVGDKTGYSVIIYDGSDNELKRQRFTSVNNDMRMTMKATLDLDAATTYKIEILRDNGKYYKKNSTLTSTNCTNVDFTEGATKGNITSTAAGSYVFTLNYSPSTLNGTDFELRLTVDYPAAANDFQILYNDNAEWSLGSAHDENWVHPSRIIRARENGVDTISFFVAKGEGISAQLKARKVSSIDAGTGAITWESLNIAEAASQSLTVDSAAVWNFKVTQGATAGTIASIENIGAYTGNYYIRCNALNSNWDNYTTDGDHRMTYSSFSESAENSFGEKFSHYKAKWCPRNTNIAFCIANDYSPCITDTLKQDVPDSYANTESDGTLKYEKDGSGNMIYNNDGNAYQDRYSANVRFMWNRKTNKISRAYVSAATSGRAKFLVLRANGEIRGEDDNPESDEDITNGVLFTDKENWMYERTLKILPGTKFKLFACYAEESPSEANAQYFRGAYDSDQFTSDANSVVLIGGTSGTYQLARIVYDFKTNRLLAAWLPSGEISEVNAINADVMIIREHQESARCITFANSSAKLSDVKTVYGVMKFNRWILNNRDNSADSDPDLENHTPLPVNQQKSTYERRLYFISFPFNVRVGDIFGFGQYGSYWVLQYYDGLSRAKNGYWLDSKPNWKYISPTQVANGYTLEANQGYLLELNLSAMAADNTTFWSNGISTIELYFPSTVAQETLKQTNCTIPALTDDYKCTINRGTAEGDRRVKDSYWRCIGVPSYNLYNSALKDGSGADITWKTDYTWQEDESEFPFIYMWNKTDNTLTPQSTSAFHFQPMHAYLTQIKSAIVWTAVSAKDVSSIVARRARKEANNEHEWRIELRQDTTFLDQTYVRMTNLEQVTDSFDFGQDLVKELNSRSNIYTFIGYEKVAANSMTVHTDQTTVIPVGANIRADGEYTFAMPEGTNGVGITLIDTEANVRTSLSALDYTVTLSAGEYTNRFFLEISPVQNTPTGLEEPTSNSSLKGRAQKKMIDGILYIVRDGKMYDARGARVE